MKTKELVQEVLEKEGVSPYKLAQEMGVKDPTVYRWKNGQREASGQHMMELLRRAGRLAAMVTLGTFVLAIGTPQDADAYPIKAEKALIIKALCIM